MGHSMYGIENLKWYVPSGKQAAYVRNLKMFIPFDFVVLPLGIIPKKNN